MGNSMENLDIISEIFLGIFVLAALVQLFFYFMVFIRFLIHRNIDNAEKVPVSIVICAKNEQENLEKNLPLICEQDYPEYEVIVVNDCSVDDTEDVLKRLKLKYSNLRSTIIKEDEKFQHGKKLALTVGIKSAKNEWMLLTDADCFPTSNHWISEMASQFRPDVSIVLGYGGFEAKKGFLNKLIRYDAAVIALQYFSFALFGRPYMGVGRNLAYRRSLFFANKGFASHARLDSGDDDLFINETATKANVACVYSIDAHTRCEAKDSFEKWADQKKRHITTFSRYKSGDIFLLGLEIFSRVIFYFSFICLLIMHEFGMVAGIIVFFRLVIQFVVFNNLYNKLNEKKLLLISPLFDFIMPFIQSGLYISNKIKPRKQWR
jgi:glycosyltransferase involved in cell wall biosynthesis